MKKILRHGRIQTSSSYYDPIIYSLGDAFSGMGDINAYKKSNPKYPKEPHGNSQSLDDTIAANKFAGVWITSYWQKEIYTLNDQDLSHFGVKVQISNGQIDESKTKFYLDNDHDANASILTAYISVNIPSTSTWTFSICYDNIEIAKASGTLYTS